MPPTSRPISSERCPIAHFDGATGDLEHPSPYFSVTAPPNWAVNDFNALVRGGRRSEPPSSVMVLNVNHILSPNGTYTEDVGDVPG